MLQNDLYNSYATNFYKKNIRKMYECELLSSGWRLRYAVGSRNNCNKPLGCEVT